MENEKNFLETLKLIKISLSGEFTISTPYTGIEFSFCANLVPKNFWIRFSSKEGELFGYLRDIWDQMKVLKISGKEGDKKFVFYFSYENYIFSLTFPKNYYFEFGSFLIKKINSLN